MKIEEKTSINDIGAYLKSRAENKDDIFVLSFKADGKVNFYQIYNKGDGLEAEELNDFSELKNIVFTNVATKERTTITEHFKGFDFNPKNGDGEIIFAYDGRNKTHYLIGVHNTNLGHAVGGLREKQYSNFDSMLTDVLRLSRGMTYKAAVAKTATGGGKATRLPPQGVRKEANLSMGRLLNFINNKREERNVNGYITAEDSNTTVRDFDEIDEVSKWAICKSHKRGGTGNPSPITALGVYAAAKAGAEFAFPDKKLDGKTVLLSGVGQCGFEVVKNFIDDGVKKVICAEMSEERIKWVKQQFERMNATEKVEFMVYTKEQLNSQQYLLDLANKVDIFAPCAMGKSINDTNINILKGSKLKLICGSENNQLADEEKHGKMLHDMGIVYVPDYVANSGGLINAVKEIPGRIFLISKVVAEAEDIYTTAKEILEKSKKENKPTYLVANEVAESRFKK